METLILVVSIFSTTSLFIVTALFLNQARYSSRLSGELLAIRGAAIAAVRHYADRCEELQKQLDHAEALQKLH